MSTHLLFLVHQEDQFESRSYVLRKMAEIWKANGTQVTVHHGSEEADDADVAVLHLDLTAVPEEYLALARKYPRIINGAVTDISKRVVSRNLLKRDDPYAGAVIVKTNLNCGGDVEARLARRGGGARKLVHKLRRKLSWTCQAQFSDYRIFPSLREVPALVWLNRHLIVERFLPERDGDLYCLRTWLFFGDRELNVRSQAREPIIKSGNILNSEPVGPPPEELRQMRRQLGFDFGKFDYAIVDGQVVLYDANRTPTYGALSEERMAPRVAHLAEGLASFFL